MALPFLVSTGLAAEVSAHKLSEWKIGKVMFGEKISKAELKGKVVVLENWGVNCPPCVASLPHLAELDKKVPRQGLAHHWRRKPRKLQGSNQAID